MIQTRRISDAVKERGREQDCGAAENVKDEPHRTNENGNGRKVVKSESSHGSTPRLCDLLLRSFDLDDKAIEDESIATPVAGEASDRYHLSHDCLNVLIMCTATALSGLLLCRNDNEELAREALDHCKKTCDSSSLINEDPSHSCSSLSISLSALTTLITRGQRVGNKITARRVMTKDDEKMKNKLMTNISFVLAAAQSAVHRDVVRAMTMKTNDPGRGSHNVDTTPLSLLRARAVETATIAALLQRVGEELRWRGYDDEKNSS